jgi:DNA-directed RNA polymerase subunit H (RpoH/RPB5)
MSFTERYYKIQFEGLAERILEELKIIIKTNLNNIERSSELLIKELEGQEGEIIRKIRETVLDIKGTTGGVEYKISLFEERLEELVKEIKNLRETDWDKKEEGRAERIEVLKEIDEMIKEMGEEKVRNLLKENLKRNKKWKN